ncbi:MAG: hypothetical protein J6K31_07230 [Parabacteroides sp.]|nr:hypothetical protein [Parabacteroides sp.]
MGCIRFPDVVRKSSAWWRTVVRLVATDRSFAGERSFAAKRTDYECDRMPEKPGIGRAKNREE